MPYYCNYNGTGYLTAPTLGNLLAANKIRVVISRLKVVGDGFIFSQAGSGTSREFGLLYAGGFLSYLYGSSTELGILNASETSSNFGTGAYFDLTLDNTANTAVLRNESGGIIKSVSLVKGAGRIDGMLFRLGARGGTDSVDTTGGFIAPNGTWIGDVKIYINDALVRDYVTPSTGTTIPDTVGGNTLAQRSTWPANDGEWIYYNSITTTGIPNNTLGAALNQACAINLNNYFTGATSYSVLSGSLPAGLSISGNQIVGTPTTAQSTTLVIRASNSIDTLDSATITFNTGLWYLNNATGGNSVVTIPSVTVGNNIGDYIEIKAVANAGNESGLYRIVGINSGYSALIGVEPTKLSISIASSNTQITTGYTQPPVGTPFTVRLRKSGTNQYTASMNGVDFAPFSGFGTFTINQLFRWATESTGAFKGGIYYVSISTNGGTSATIYYDPNTNGGVGNLLIDRVSNQNGTQAGTWPADNREWVFYSSGATYQLTAQGGTFTYSGQTAALNRGFKLAAQGGAYSYTGSSANLSYTTATIYRLDALGTSYSYAGASASLLRGFVLDAQGGVYSYAGADASLTYVAGPTVYRLTALGVTYVYSGADATLTATGVIPAANPAAFVNRAYVGGTLTNNAQVGGRLTNNAKIGGSLTNNATVAI